MKNIPRNYTVKEATKALRIGRSLLYTMIADGRIRTILIGGKRMVPEGEIIRITLNGTGETA